MRTYPGYQNGESPTPEPDYDDLLDSLCSEHFAFLTIEDSYKYPERTLDRLLDTVLKDDSRHRDRYSDLLEGDRHTLRETLLQCMRSEVMELFADSGDLVPGQRYGYYPLFFALKLIKFAEYLSLVATLRRSPHQSTCTLSNYNLNLLKEQKV